MTVFGLTPQGFVGKTLDDIKTEIEDDERAAFGNSLDLGSGKSVFGNINGIMSERFADLWALAQALDTGRNPDGATDTSLDDVCAITGTVREHARASEVTLTLGGSPGTVVAAGRQASVVSTLVKFQTLADATIGSAVADWTSDTYAAGDRTHKNGFVYKCLVGGFSSTGPTSVVLGAIDTSDGSLHWQVIASGAGTADVLASAVNTGPLVALAGTLITIETPVSGWESVCNAKDAQVGADVEEDPDLRVRREAEVVVDANATIPAIRSKLLRVDELTNDPVTSVRVFQNTGMVPDDAGRPPKSVEALVLGGSDQAIGDALFKCAPAGIETVGNVSVSVTADDGTVWVVKFSRPTPVDIWIIINIQKDSSFATATGTQDIQGAIIAAGEKYTIGKDVTASAVGNAAWKVQGVTDTGLPLIARGVTPTDSVALPMTDHELAHFDSSNIVVNITDGPV